MPEYEDCRVMAQNAEVPLRLVHEAAVAAAQSRLGGIASKGYYY